jgi:tRNA(fMet)-specific endonuclease VapC
VPYLLDTNILIAVSKKRPGLSKKLSALPASDILLSSVVLAEIEYGIAKSAKPELNRQVYDSILRGFAVADFGVAAARHYGALRLGLERRGEIIGPNDSMIAAQALATGAVLVTDNTAEFSRVPGLAVENWLAA